MNNLSAPTPSQLAARPRQPRRALAAPSPRLDPPLPGLGIMAKNAAITAAQTAVAFIQGRPIFRDEAAAEKCEAICRTNGPNGAPCPWFRVTDNRCGKCGCGGGDKLIDMWSISEKHCPLNLW